MNGIWRNLHSLGVGLLKERTPELILVIRAQKVQSILVRGQSVINYNLCPLAIPPESEAEDTAVVLITEILIQRHHATEQFLTLAQAPKCSQQPTIPWLRKKEFDGMSMAVL